jgi:hypothetical protein
VETRAFKRGKSALEVWKMNTCKVEKGSLKEQKNVLLNVENPRWKCGK